ncbi:TIGR03086 family metal-binding protein [Nonomuraea jiangxiensis]|uniref:TIGR03086 family protein n=1 Tax=Nonomuraea jiangxiensis TaxID=633440 RepID=A0A1G8ICD2_9ACTN|nr:TIGR03086 family metal-binding protein [Nonomuraea jiangxiensis]SDI16441.1 TIGR03086 family protein [Nonomuraea jiangxiensis]
MSSSDDTLDLLERALAQVGAVIAAVRPDQAELPTPCRSWDVRALVNHVTDEVHQFAVVTAGGKREHLGLDVIGDDWAGAFRAVADELLEVWRQPGALDRPQHLSIGDFPPSWALGQQITELTVHAWDIAKATGQSTDLDPELGKLALTWAGDNLRPEFRGDESEGYQIGHEKPVDPDAPLYERLAAIGGRDPG